jgi:fatty-acyl-CoA synthase
MQTATGLGHTMMRVPLTLPHFLERAAKLFPRVEIVWRRPDRSVQRYTYADFHRRARALAEALQRAGLRSRDRVATLLWNHSAHLEAYFGVPCSGGVLHTLNLRLHPSDIAYVAEHAQDRFLIADDVLLPLVDQVRSRWPFERVFVVRWTDAPLPAGYEDYEDLLSTATGNWDYPPLEEDAPVGMCYTSGTTGRPKGVVYSHRSLVLHSLVAALPDALGLSQRDVVCPVVPMFHVNAWGIPFTATLLGCKQVFPGPHLDPVHLLDLFEAEGVTVTAGVPTIWLGVLDALRSQPGRWRLRLRTLVVGGSAAPESMIRAYDQLGLHVLHAWGMTEMSPLGTVSRLKSTLADLPEDERYAYRAKQGLPAPLLDVRAVSDQGEVPWDGHTMGELQVRGPWVAAAYHGGEEPERWTPDGWFRTGDVVTVDPEGYVKIVDRTKDLIKSGGEWISSVDLENALMAHPAVKEAAVVAVPHPRWGERPLAVVVLREGHHATPEELRAFLEPHFARWWLPDGFVFVPEIPKTSAGKFQKAKLREQFRNGWR